MNLNDMQALSPALEASGFFEYCRQNPVEGVHDLQLLTALLYSRRYKHEELLRKSVETLKVRSKFILWGQVITDQIWKIPVEIGIVLYIVTLYKNT